MLNFWQQVKMADFFTSEFCAEKILWDSALRLKQTGQTM